METLVKTKKKIKFKLSDFAVESFITSNPNNIMFTNHHCGEVDGVYMDKTGNTQCKANGGCVDATAQLACYTMVGGCDLTFECVTVACSNAPC